MGLHKDKLAGRKTPEVTAPPPAAPDVSKEVGIENSIQKKIEHVGVKKEVTPAPPPPAPPPPPSVSAPVAPPSVAETEQSSQKKGEDAPVKKPNCAICGLLVEGTIPEEELKAGKTIVHNDCYSKYLREQKAKANT